MNKLERFCATAHHENVPAVAMGLLYSGTDDECLATYCQECVDTLGRDFRITRSLGPTKPVRERPGSWVIDVCRTCGRLAVWPFCEHRSDLGRWYESVHVREIR
jgi:hypothetical protein